jgi:peptidoglycan/xylan/chitin deacetylase (PgdA/CDA1 family)
MNRDPSDLRSVLFRSIARILHVSGFLTVARPLLERTRLFVDEEGKRSFPYVRRRRRPAAQILIYHRVNDELDPYFRGVPTAVFEQQMEYVASRFRILRLTDLVAGLRAGSIPENALAITFDDGYRDNYRNAFPVLRRLRIPATVYLATSAISSRRQLWHDDVFSAFRSTAVPELRPIGPGRVGGSLATVPERLRVQHAFLGYVRTLDEMQRTNAILRLRDALQVGPSPEAPGLMLEWDEVKEMSAAGVEFGSHTVSHPILSRMGRIDAQRELVESKCAIEERLGVRVEGFAYPNGTRADYTAETKALLREAGYSYAVTTVPGSNEPGDDLFELRRATPWDEDVFAFGLRLRYNKLCS